MRRKKRKARLEYVSCLVLGIVYRGRAEPLERKESRIALATGGRRLIKPWKSSSACNCDRRPCSLGRAFGSSEERVGSL